MCPTTFLDSVSNEHCRNLAEIINEEKLTRLNKNNHYLDGNGIIAIIRATIYVVQWGKTPLCNMNGVLLVTNDH